MKYSLLGLSCEKGEDVIGITFSTTAAEPTKRGIPGKIAKIYDPLGFASPVTLKRKILYREACDAKVPWDGALPKGLTSRWEKWERSLPKLVRVQLAWNVVRHKHDEKGRGGGGGLCDCSETKK